MGQIAPSIGTVRRASALAVALLLAGAAARSAPQAPEDDPGETGFSVSHEPVTCMLAGRHPLIDAGFAPESSVQSARVFFHSALGELYYYVEMEAVGNRHVGILPRPRADAGPVTYYVEGIATDLVPARSAETLAIVVESESECQGRLAAYLPGTTPVRVFALGGSTALPPGFGGVGSVVAQGAVGGATTTVATTAPSTGSALLSSRSAAIVFGATTVGLATALILSNGDEPPPVSPSR